MPAIMPMTATCDSDHYTCLGHLGQRDINRNNPICVASSKVTKTNTVKQSIDSQVLLSLDRFLFFVAPPKVAKASTAEAVLHRKLLYVYAVMSRCCWRFC
jgi:hypothetical protein